MLLIILFDRRIYIYVLFIIPSIRFSCENNKIFNKIIRPKSSKSKFFFFNLLASNIFAYIFLLFVSAFKKKHRPLISIFFKIWFKNFNWTVKKIYISIRV